MAKTCIGVERFIRQGKNLYKFVKYTEERRDQNKFSFYDRSGKFGDPFMNREYIELTP